MKLYTGLLALACATVVSAQAQAPLHSAEDETLKVPGDNPFYFYPPETSEPYILNVTSLNLVPKQPKPGQKVKISAEGNIAKAVENGAYADVVVKLGLIKLLQRRFDLCAEAKKAKEKECPYEEGSWSFSTAVEISKEAPPAKFRIEMRAYTVDDEDLLGMYGKIDLTPKIGMMG